MIIMNEENLPPMEEIDGVPQLEKDKKDICGSIGTMPQMPILTEQNQLLRTERTTKRDDDKKLVYIDSFIYNSDNELQAIEDRLININDELIFRDIYKFEFKDGLLIEVKQDDPTLPVRRDSLVYDTNGKLLSIFNFKLQREPFISLSNPYYLFSIDSFFYDNKGYLNYRNCYWLNQEQHFSHNIYCWEDGNLTNVKNYNAEGELISERIITYSEVVEFKVLHSDPRFWESPEVWSKNKVIENQLFDYVGNIDLLCNPCDTKYEYDELGRITKIENEFATARYAYRN